MSYLGFLGSSIIEQFDKVLLFSVGVKKRKKGLSRTLDDVNVILFAAAKTGS